MSKRTSFDKFIESYGQPKQKKIHTTSTTREHPKVTATPRGEFPFKQKNFQHSAVVKSGKKKSWKGLQQIATMERSQCNPDDPTYLNIDSPPSLKPAKKYSDISGQLAIYTDPETGLYYATAEEYKLIKRLTTDLVNGYLALRNASHV